MSGTQIDDLTPVREEARRLLREQVHAERLEKLLDTPGGFDAGLWRLAGEQGWLAVGLSEARGGMDLGWPGVAALSEEMGRSLAALPLIAGTLAADMVARSSDSELEDAWLDRLRDGISPACLALPGPNNGEIFGAGEVRSIEGRLHGRVSTVAFGAVAELALVAAASERQCAELWMVPLVGSGVTREVIPTLDDANGFATLQFEGVLATRLGDERLLAQTVERAATLAAFEQIGGAQASLALAIEHALQRQAFGQAIARFQAIKHKLVEVYAAIEIARGCALTALELLDEKAGNGVGNDAASAAQHEAVNAVRHEAVAAARVAASQAYEQAARECISVFGALGLTREAVPHRHYRRARSLALELGSTLVWRERLVQDFVARVAVTGTPDMKDAGAGANSTADSNSNAKSGSTAGQCSDSNHHSASDALVDYTARARAWLAQHAPQYSGATRRGLGFEADLALGRAWQSLKAQHGYAGITLPKAYGGAGGSELQKLAFTEEEMRYDLPLVYFSVSLSNPIPIFLKYAPEPVCVERAPRALRGEEIWCQMFSEPGAGSDLAALRTRAERDGDGWRLNGQKTWTSWAQIADWGVIVVRTDPTVPKHAGLTYLFVNMKSAGITVRPIRRLGGERDLNEVFFDNVWVPDEQRLGGVGEGFRVAIETLMIERYAVVDESGYAPPLEALVNMAAARRVAGHSALENGEFRGALAQGLIERTGLRNIHRRALTAMITGKEPGPEGSLRKLLLGRSRQRLASLAMDLQGPEALRLPPDARAGTHFTPAWLDPSLRIAGGTDEMLLNTLAERVLGLPQDHRPDKGKPFNRQE
jgi:alkylation response protein AidB-like acyl-CoA dehydrogenase